jgi:simple sugar transport system substrate-binding protein
MNARQKNPAVVTGQATMGGISMRKSGVALAALTALFAGNASLADEPKPVKISYIIYTETGNIFWNPALQGIKDAAKAFNADVDIQYADADPVKQNNLIEAAIANKVDGIAVMLFTPTAFAKNVQKARDAGIAVVSVNIDDASTARQAYVGADSKAAGYKIGQRMVKECHLGKGDKVFDPVEYPDATYAHDRFAGVTQALNEVGAAGETLGTGAGFDEALPKMTQYLLGHKDTKCVISLGGTPTGVAAQAIEQAGLNIPNGGFDLNKLIIKNLQDGKLIATMDQQPYMQGFAPIMEMAEYVRYGLTPFDANTGLAVVDKSSVDKVAKYTGTYR